MFATPANFVFFKMPKLVYHRRQAAKGVTVMNGQCLRCGKSKTVAGPQCSRCVRDFTPGTPEQHRMAMQLLGDEERALLRISDRLDGAGFWASPAIAFADAEHLAK